MERDTSVLGAGAEIMAPCDDLPPPVPPMEMASQPYLVADPTCGDLSTMNQQRNTVLSSSLRLVGQGFAPNTETEIWWVDPRGADYILRKEGKTVTLPTDDQGGFQVEIIMPFESSPAQKDARSTGWRRGRPQRWAV